MARRRYGKKRRGSHKMTVPVAIAAPAVWAMYRFVEPAIKGNMPLAVMQVTGYNFATNALNLGALYDTYGPVLVGAVIHKGASMFGVNRALGRMKIPLLRI